MWAGLDSNQRRHKPADLQSAPFDRFGTDPFFQDKNNLSQKYPKIKSLFAYIIGTTIIKNCQPAPWRSREY